MKRKSYNYGLPNDFMLHSFLVFQDIGFSQEGNKPSAITTLKDFESYLNEPYNSVNCQLLAKDFIGLPKLPIGYYFSLLVTLVVSIDDFKRLEKKYPSKYRAESLEFNSEHSYGDQDLLAGVAVFKPSPELIKDEIKQYFNVKKYEKPVPVSIQYTKCGCYIEDVTIDAYEENGWDEFIYEFDNYNKVSKNFPLRLNQFTKVDDFLLSVAGQVNEYSENKLLSGDRFIETAKLLMKMNLLSKLNKLEASFVKDLLNPQIKTCRTNSTVENDFYLEHFIRFLDELEGKKVLKRCQHCYEAFKYHERRLYCTDKCGKVARNKRDYLKHIEKRRKNARKFNAELREFYKEKRDIRLPSQ